MFCCQRPLSRMILLLDFGRRIFKWHIPPWTEWQQYKKNPLTTLWDQNIHRMNVTNSVPGISTSSIVFHNRTLQNTTYSICHIPHFESSKFYILFGQKLIGMLLDFDTRIFKLTLVSVTSSLDEASCYINLTWSFSNPGFINEKI